MGGDGQRSSRPSCNPPPLLRVSCHLRRADRGARSSCAAQIPRHSSAAHLERCGTRIAHGSELSHFTRLSPAGIDVDDAGRIAGKHGVAFRRSTPPRSHRCRSRRRRPAHPKDKVPQGSPGPGPPYDAGGLAYLRAASRCGTWTGVCIGVPFHASGGGASVASKAAVE